MAAYVFMDFIVTDSDLHAEYRERAVRVQEAYGGKLMGRGDVVESTDGELTSRRRIMAVEFPTVDQAKAWLELRDGTPDQREVRELRARMGHDIRIHVVNGDN